MPLLSRRFLARRPRPRILIAGGNFAGLAAARTLDTRRVQVTVVDPSPRIEWLPNVHELLSRRKRPEQLQHDRREALARMGHDFLCDSAIHIDRSQQRVHTASGERLDYDVLILAVGRTPHDHGVPGVHEHAMNTRSVESCARIGNTLTRLAALPEGRDVVVTGGGIEGVEMLGEILRHQSLSGRNTGRFNLHLVEMADALFPRFPGLHERLLGRMQGQVRLHLGRRVVAVGADSVTLDDGTRLPARLVLWSAGSRGHPLPVAALLAEQGDDAPVRGTLQSADDGRIFVAGDAARLPAALEKQAYHAQDTGRHAALNARRLLAGKPLLDFRPLPRPALVSFGDRDAFLVFDRQVLATPALLTLKEGIYQYGYHQMLPPRSGRDLADLARDLRHGVSTLDVWRTLAASGDASLFHAR